MSSSHSAVDATHVLHEGEWTHRFISANGARFHLAESGAGPLVILLHGFPQFWWAWRAVLPALAKAGFRAAALDLRGYGASDKPPRGYDTANLAADVAAVIRSLGAEQAVVIGHDWGAWIAWAMPTLEPECTRAIIPISMAHPLALSRAMRSNPAQLRASRRQWNFQLPFQAERRLTRPDFIVKYLNETSGTTWPSGDPTALSSYATALRVPFVAHSALEYFRWGARAPFRAEGRAFADRLAEPITLPVLQIHGARDPLILPTTAGQSSRWVRGDYQWTSLSDGGHYLLDEHSDLLLGLVLPWLLQLPK